MKAHPPNSQRYLSDVLTKTGITHVTELAAALECSRATLHEQLNGARQMSPTQAIRVARLLQASTLEILAATQYHQARRAADRALWLGLWSIAKRRQRITL